MQATPTDIQMRIGGMLRRNDGRDREIEDRLQRLEASIMVCPHSIAHPQRSHVCYLCAVEKQDRELTLEQIPIRRQELQKRIAELDEQERLLKTVVDEKPKEKPVVASAPAPITDEQSASISRQWRLPNPFRKKGT